MARTHSKKYETSKNLIIVYAKLTGFKTFITVGRQQRLRYFLNFCVSSQSSKAPLTYRQCQLKLLQKKVHHKKSASEF